jgi:hypothetical protein
LINWKPSKLTENIKKNSIRLWPSFQVKSVTRKRRFGVFLSIDEDILRLDNDNIKHLCHEYGSIITFKYDIFD